ncbi:MAG: ATP-dependent helicase [Nitrospirota bacterium]
MIEKSPLSADDLFDAVADDEIVKCITADPPISFFLFAGAGSGKTRSLVQALRVIKEKKGARLRLNGRRVGVITFTNNACNEIIHRLEFDELFAVSTIHSFAWSLIKGLDADIKEWLKINLAVEIAELEEKERSGRPNTKASFDRQNSIASKNERLESIIYIKKFIYNPDSDNPERNALNHAEVIKIASAFLKDKPVMRSLLVNRFPILLIDESQDTNKELLESLFFVESNLKSRFALGIIGDTMQRIYISGTDIVVNLPEDWAKPVKEMNHRSRPRIIELINRIRERVDDQIQKARTDKSGGFVRLFILPDGVADKPDRENGICRRMAEITGDEGWGQPKINVKTLILEHRMAAIRLGFLPMWDALSGVDRLQTGLRDGKLPGLRFFSHLILPLIKAHQKGDKFVVASIIRNDSPLLERKALEACSPDQMNNINNAREAVDSLAALATGNTPTFLQLLQMVYKTKLFELPEVLLPFAKHVEPRKFEEAGEDEINDELIAWRSFLETAFDQIESYSLYIQGEAQYDTHQGIKGLEFPRVCVVMDDSGARGFMFSYEKLFGAREDYRKKDPGQETSIDRTRRLFYVTCSRAKDSLALIAYTANPQMVKNHVIKEGWFKEEEIELLL